MRSGRKQAGPASAADAGMTMAHNYNFNTVAAVVFIVLAVILFVIIPGQIEKPLVVLPEQAKNLKAEFFPRLVAAAMLVLGIWFLIKSFSIEETNQFLELDRSAFANVAATLAVMAIYGPLMMAIGFVVSSAIMIAVLATFYGNRNYALTAFVAIVVPVAIFFTFTKLLATSLPPFPIDTILTRYYIL